MKFTFSILTSVFLWVSMAQAGEKIRVYLSGPLFNAGERAVMLALDATVSLNPDVSTFLPQRDGVEANIQDDINSSFKIFPEWFSRAVFAKDFFEIYYSHIVVANLDGMLVDDGVAVELGLAHALGRPVLLFSSKPKFEAPSMIQGTSTMKVMEMPFINTHLLQMASEQPTPLKKVSSAADKWNICVAGPVDTMAEKITFDRVIGTLDGKTLSGKPVDTKQMDRTGIAGSFERNKAKIASCDLMLAMVGGLAPDIDSAVEIGLAYGAGVPVVLYHGDDRTLFNGSINAMVAATSKLPPAKNISDLPKLIEKGLKTEVNHADIIAQASRKKTLDGLGKFIPVLKPRPASEEDKALARRILEVEGINAKID